MSSIPPPLTVILIVILILHESITVTAVIFELSSIYFSISVCSNSVTVEVIILALKIVDSSILIFDCQVTFSLAMFVLPPVTVKILPLFLSNSIQVIFMPFSDILAILKYHYSNSLSLTLCIKVASVLALIPTIVTIFVFNIYEPVFDGLKFRLKQPMKLFLIGYMQNSIWKHLKAVVNLHHFLAFPLHDDLKTLMCRF